MPVEFHLSRRRLSEKDQDHVTKEVEQTNVNIVENTYCKVVGLGRNIENQNGLIIFKIMPLNSYEEVLFHILKSWHNKLAETMIKDEPPVCNSSNVNSTNNSVDNFSTMGFPSSKAKVLKILSEQAGPSGMHVDKILEGLHNSISKSELMNILNFFVDEGHIYSTIDSNHFIAMK